jgi:hypothetical protein
MKGLGYPKEIKVFSRAAVVGKVRDGKINFEVHLKSGGTT